jgi:hypothetical protein
MSDELPPLCGKTDDVCPPYEDGEDTLWSLLPLAEDRWEVEQVAVLGYN